MTVKEMAQTYNQFQQDYGQENSKDYDALIEKIFAPDFQKIANGVCLVDSRSKLLFQLSEVKHSTGKWRVVEEKELIPAAAEDKCVIRYILETEKAGNFEIITILNIDRENRINKIDEVFYQIA